MDDPEHLIRTSIGTGLRDIGEVDAGALAAFPRAHAETMPRITLGMAIARLPEAERTRWLSVGKRSG